MRKLEFVHTAKKYRRFSNRYIVTSNGRVFKAKSGKELNYHRDLHKRSKGARFVRLSDGKGGLLSITVARLILLTFRPDGYKKNGIEQRAIHKDGIKLNDKLGNLIWGDNAKQSAINMKDPKVRKRVANMAKKYYGKK